MQADEARIDFERANLENANLSHAKFLTRIANNPSIVTFKDASLTNADLSGLKIETVDSFGEWGDTDSSVSFENADLSNADLSELDVDAEGYDAAYVDFSNADLSSADFSNADIRAKTWIGPARVKFDGADVTDMDKTGLTVSASSPHGSGSISGLPPTASPPPPTASPPPPTASPPPTPTAPSPLPLPPDIDSSLKDCTALDDETTCTKKDKKRIERKCSGGGGHKCRKMCKTKYKKLSTDCKAACCPSFTPCQGKLEQFEGPSSTTLSINCPPGPGKVWGSNPYSQDSVFGKAVRHACSGRPISVSIVNVGCQDSYVGSTKNGITTRDWGYYCDAYQITCL